MFQFIMPLYPIGRARVGDIRKIIWMGNVWSARLERRSRTKKADSSRSRRSSSTYENYNFPDSKVLWLSSKGACTRPFTRQFSHSVYLIRKTLTLSKSRFDGDESTKTSKTSWWVFNRFFEVGHRATGESRLAEIGISEINHISQRKHDGNIVK